MAKLIDTLILRSEFSYRYEFGEGKADGHGRKMMNQIGVAEPSWIHKKTNFISVPYFQVIQEIQRQYDITISGSTAYKDTLYTGSFTHENLDTALQAITIPLNLSYVMKGTEVVLKEIP